MAELGIYLFNPATLRGTYNGEYIIDLVPGDGHNGHWWFTFEGDGWKWMEMWSQSSGRPFVG